MYKYLGVLIGSLIFLSCTENQPQPSDVSDPFLTQITSDKDEAAVVDSYIIKTPSVNRLGGILRWSDDHLIVEDRAQRTLKLLHMDGSEVATAGGTGRGPGEFELINQLHKGSDGYLYVLDRNLTRVSKFMVADDEFEYMTSFSPEVPDQMFLTNIFVTPSGVYTLLNHRTNYRIGANSYLLYKADSRFNPDEVLFEFEGTEKIGTEQGLFTDHPLANRTLWSQSGVYFYTLSSHRSSWQKRNLLTGTIVTLSYTGQADRENTNRSKAYLADRLKPVIDVEPVVKEAIDESKLLPLNHDMISTDDWIVISTFYAGGSDKIVILHNQESRETAYCSVPPHFFPAVFNGRELIGKSSSSEGDIKMELIEIELTERL